MNKTAYVLTTIPLNQQSSALLPDHCYHLQSPHIRCGRELSGKLVLKQDGGEYVCYQVGKLIMEYTYVSGEYLHSGESIHTRRIVFTLGG